MLSSGNGQQQVPVGRHAGREAGGCPPQSARVGNCVAHHVIKLTAQIRPTKACACQPSSLLAPQAHCTEGQQALWSVHGLAMLTLVQSAMIPFQ